MKVRACIAGESLTCTSDCRFYNKKHPEKCFKLNPKPKLTLNCEG